MAIKRIPPKPYWERRAERRILAGEEVMNKSEAVQRLLRAYDESSSRITKEVDSFFLRYAREEHITPAIARESLDSKSRESYVEQAKRYINILEHMTEPAFKDEKLSQFRRMLSGKAYVTKMDEIKLAMQIEVDKLKGLEVEATRDVLTDTYKDSFYSSLYDIQKGTSLGVDFTRLDDKSVKVVLDTPWLEDNYSSRIWKHRDKLVAALPILLANEFLVGHGPVEVARKLQQAIVGTSKVNAERLIRTEMNHISNVAMMNAYTASGVVDQYKYSATLDNRTSEICQELDGKVFDVKEGQVGLNMPPMHPNCRSATIPHFPDDDIGRLIDTRIARNEKGKNYTVPGDQTYVKWAKAKADEAYAASLASRPSSVLDLLAGFDAGGPSVDELFDSPDVPMLTSEEIRNQLYEGVDEEEIQKLPKDIIRIALGNGDDETFEKGGMLGNYGMEKKTAAQRLAILANQMDRLINENQDGSALSRIYASDAFVHYAKKTGIIDEGEPRHYDKATDKYGIFMIDMRVNNITYEKAYNRMLTGFPTSKIEDYTSDVYLTLKGSSTTGMHQEAMVELGRYSKNMRGMAEYIPMGEAVKNMQKLYQGYTASSDSIYSALIEARDDASLIILEDLKKGYPLRMARLDLETKKVMVKALDLIAKEPILDTWEAVDKAHAILKAPKVPKIKPEPGAAPSNDVPKSLKKYDEYADKFEVEYERGWTDEQKKIAKEFCSIADEAMERGALYTRVGAGSLSDPQKMLQKIMNDGRFKTQHETGHTGGYYNPEARRKASRNLFGHDSKGFEQADYEKYGYLGNPDPLTNANDGAANQYGVISVKFKKANLANRTTMTMGDSLSAAMYKGNVPSRLGKWRPAGVLSSIRQYGIDNTLEMKRRNRERFYTPNEFAQTAFGHRYVETQYHGDIFTTDIEEVHLVTGRYSSIQSPDMNLVKQMKDQGIRVLWVDPDRLEVKEL